jgi:PAS domain S-box-containing protein
MHSEQERLREENARYRQVIDELAVHERMYHTLFESAHDAVFLLDGYRIADCNRRAVEIFGYARGKLIGSDFTSLSGTAAELRTQGYRREQEYAQPRRELARQFERMNDRGTRFFQWSFERSDATEFRCEVSLAPLTLYERQFYFASVRDISVRTRFERDLRLRTAQLQATLESLPFDFWINDTENRTFMQNSYSTQLWGTHTGRHMEEVTLDEEIKREWRESNHRALAGEVVEKEISYGSNGDQTIFRNIVAPVREEDRVIGILGLNIDITDYKQTQQQLEESLRQVEVLLKEIHHRVKNNLQIISSMISLEKAKVDPGFRRILHDIENRIGTMALIHEQLYSSESLDTIRMHDYLDNLTGSIASTFSLHEKKIEIRLEVEEILLSLETAIPLGIMANELITNSIKHAFPETGGTITIVLQEMDESYHFAVQDDGQGMTEHQSRELGLGLTLVQQLSRQIKGQAVFDFATGYSVSVSFPKEVSRI